jgi:zinc/manganese transport system ATP-binding protein
MMNKPTTIIRAKRLTVAYNDRTIWREAEFSIKTGEFVGLLGSNGAGKTTLFKLLLGLIRPTSGDLLLFDEKPRKGSTRIGYVPQRRPIDIDTKIEALEYVRLGFMGSGIGISMPSRATLERSKGLDALKLVDAVALAHRPLSELSGGELQRIFLAQALVSEPELLLLDEPLANLDIRRENELIHLIADIVHTRNIAVLLIAHDINPLLPAIDRIIYIANGKIASGPPEKVVTSKSLSQLYNASIEVVRDSKGRMAVFGIEGAQYHDE